MSSELISTRYTAGANIYFRLFDPSTGYVFDFDDDTFKSLSGGSPTTPYIVATEYADMDGTGYSEYVAEIDLDDVHAAGDAKRFILKAYDNATPAAADVSVSDSISIEVEFGSLGRKEICVQVEMNVKSTEGNTVQIAVWLEHGSAQIDIGTVDAAASAQVTVREHGAGANKFVKSFSASDLKGGGVIFEAEQSTPAFTDDRGYSVTARVTENGNNHETQHAFVVIG